MASETHAFRAYQHLRHKFLSGDFEPGQRLLYGPIGKEIGVSATPVREAAGQLANEGLVTLVPQLGAVVRKIDRDELTDIYEVRTAIEPFAAKLAAERSSAETTEQIGELLKQMELLASRQSQAKRQFAGKALARKFDISDYSFHMAVIGATENQTMIRTAGQSNLLTRVFGIRRHRYDADSMKLTCRDHRAIFKAIREGDGERAQQAALRHIQNGLKVSLAALG